MQTLHCRQVAQSCADDKPPYARREVCVESVLLNGIDCGLVKNQKKLSPRGAVFYGQQISQRIRWVFLVAPERPVSSSCIQKVECVFSKLFKG